MKLFQSHNKLFDIRQPVFGTWEGVPGENPCKTRESMPTQHRWASFLQGSDGKVKLHEALVVVFNSYRWYSWFKDAVKL